MTVLPLMRTEPGSPLPDLVALARNPSVDARQRLLMGVLTLCETQGASEEDLDRRVSSTLAATDPGREAPGAPNTTRVRRPGH